MGAQGAGTLNRRVSRIGSSGSGTPLPNGGGDTGPRASDLEGVGAAALTGSKWPGSGSRAAHKFLESRVAADGIEVAVRVRVTGGRAVCRDSPLQPIQRGLCVA